jgi:Mitochondrial small ribosomal subunit Rsm22
MSFFGSSLLPPPTRELDSLLEAFGGLLDKSCPVRPKHRAAIPAGVRQLSAYLTTDRDEMPRDYMSRPDLLNAYLRWFLPWNLYRQGRLLQGLDLDIPAGSRIVDLGAGPMTFLLSLWMSRPHLRERALEYIALDRAEPALQAGRNLFSGLTGPEKSPWTVRTERAMAGHGRLPRADLLVAANFLNELESSVRTRRRGLPESGEPDEDPGGGGLERVLLNRWEKQVTATGALLLIEPGTRPAGRQLSRIREAAIDRGWTAAAPCPHAADCPLPGTSGGAWCHFTFATDRAPRWLEYLARKVRLPKERTSLAFLLLTRPKSPIKIRPTPVTKPGEGVALVVSEPFDLPDQKRGRYGCSEKGMVLLEGKPGDGVEGPHPGERLVVRWPDQERRDLKSGALILSRSVPPTNPSGPPSRGRK